MHTPSATPQKKSTQHSFTASAHTLRQKPDKILFGCFVTTLNAAFEQKLALQDEGYESSSENFNIPTPLRRTEDPPHVQC